MKTKIIRPSITLALLAAGLLISGSALAADDASTNTPPAAADETAQAPAVPADQMPQPAAADATPAAPAQPEAQPAPAAEAAATPQAATAPQTTAAPAAGPSDKLIHLNFRGVPLEMVLNYLSDAAGFIINPQADIHGKVDVWSNQALTKDEAVELLGEVLKNNGLGVVRDGKDGRILKIMTIDQARTSDIPIRTGNNPDRIPKNDEIVTQIIPVRSLNAVQLTKDLAPLLPSDTTLTANDAGNSLVMTDRQSNIRRITEIIKALDSVTTGANALRVFSLKYADAKALVTVVKDLFPSQDTANNGRGGGGFGRFQRFFGGGGGGGGGFGGGGGGGSADTGHTPSTHVSATSDDHSNSLIVSAPEDLMPTIEQLVNSVDTSVEDLTEIKVFTLKHADPGEMADLLGNLFPEDTGSSDASRAPAQFFGRFGGGPFGGGQGGQQNNANSPSDRMKRLGRVIAVPDKRTRSLVVTAAKDLMPQIVAMVDQLDNNDANMQRVYVFSLKNADPMDVQQNLQDLFPSSSNSRYSSGNNSQNNVLQNRLSTISQQQLQGSGSSLGGSSFGNGGGGGGRGGF